jgi:hypothetical protein
VKITAGDSNGSLHIYDVLPEVSSPVANESDVLEGKINLMSEELLKHRVMSS